MNVNNHNKARGILISAMMVGFFSKESEITLLGMIYIGVSLLGFKGFVLFILIEEVQVHLSWNNMNRGAEMKKLKAYRGGMVVVNEWSIEVIVVILKLGAIVLSLEPDCKSVENKAKEFGLILEGTGQPLMFYIELNETEGRLNFFSPLTIG